MGTNGESKRKKNGVRQKCNCGNYSKMRFISEGSDLYFCNPEACIYEEHTYIILKCLACDGITINRYYRYTDENIPEEYQPREDILDKVLYVPNKPRDESIPLSIVHVLN